MVDENDKTHHYVTGEVVDSCVFYVIYSHVSNTFLKKNVYKSTHPLPRYMLQEHVGLLPV